MWEKNKIPIKTKLKKDQYNIWLVDDLKSNREDFMNFFDDPKNNPRFSGYASNNIEDVKTLLGDEIFPDALLCDIFWYDEQGKAQEVEDMVREDTEAMKDHIAKLKYHVDYLGINLAKFIKNNPKLNPTPFPIYAFTSKGAYLLGEKQFDEIEEAGMLWLFKIPVKSKSTNGDEYHLRLHSVVSTLEKDIKSYEKFEEHPIKRVFYYPSRRSIFMFTIIPLVTSIVEACYIIAHLIFKI